MTYESESLDKKTKNKVTESTGTGIAAISACIISVIGLGYYFDYKIDLAKIDLEKAKIERGITLQERDLNGNGIPEKFYEIDGKRYFLEIDGKNIEDTLKNK